jgi:hypothetical protein
MGRIIFVALFVFLFCQTEAQHFNKIDFPNRIDNSKSYISINGIKSELIYEFYSKGNNLDSTLENKVDYDEEGNIVNYQTYSKDILSSDENYYYSLNGKILKRIEKGSSSRAYRVREYEYDSLGNEIREYIYNKDTTQLTINFKVYNSKNLITEYYTKKNNDSIRLYKIYSYNEADVLTKIEVYDEKGKLNSTYKYVLDANNIYKTAYFQSERDTNQKEEFIFNDLNNCVRINGYALQPITYINEEDNSIYKTEMKVLPKVTDFIYNSNGTIHAIVQKTEGNATKTRKHYYTTY